MGRVLLTGFTESNISNRIISSCEDIKEYIDLRGGQCQIFFLTFSPGTIRETHTHEEVRLTIVRFGTMKLTVEQKEMVLGTGDFISTLPKVPHKLEVVGTEALRLIEFVFPNQENFA